MRILVAGASGLIGTSLVSFLAALGHEVHRLVRGAGREPGEIPWDPAHGGISKSSVEGFDAAVCLSGAGITDARWTPARKALLRDSRVEPLSLLARTLAACEQKPECLVCASATGYFGADRGAEVLTDDSAPGSDFVAGLCSEWEAAASPARDAGIRVVHLRFGIVLTPAGGALKRMLVPFRLGLGGRFGNGKQYVSWLTLNEAVGIIDHVIQTDTLDGPLNAVAPNPVTNSELARALGRAVRRPAVACVPGFVLRAAMGEMSALVLGSVRMYPRRLEASGYKFRDPEIYGALREMLTG